MQHKNMIVKKYIQYNLILTPKKKYTPGMLQGNYCKDLASFDALFDFMTAEEIIYYFKKDSKGFENNSLRIDVVSEFGIKRAEITNLDLVDFDRYYEPDYTLSYEHFFAAIQKYTDCMKNNINQFYLIILQNNHVLLQEQLTDNNQLIFPSKWLKYAKVAYVAKNNCYKSIDLSSSEFIWLLNLPFYLNADQPFLQQYEYLKKNELISKDISFEIVSKIIEEWNLLKSEEQPVYFVKEDDGSITVRKTILDLKYVKLEINESGEYHVADEYGIEVFDFLEEFVIGFDPEKWFAEFEHAITGDSGYQVHQNVEILYSIKEHFVLLRLGQAPQEYEYIERDRAQYKENRDVFMPLDDFQNLMQQWLDLKREKTSEIWFRQKDNGSIVINNVTEFFF
jgi:hypothetical protein